MDSEAVCIVKSELSFSLREISKLLFLESVKNQNQVLLQKERLKNKQTLM